MEKKIAQEKMKHYLIWPPLNTEGYDDDLTQTLKSVDIVCPRCKHEDCLLLGDGDNVIFPFLSNYTQKFTAANIWV